MKMINFRDCLSLHERLLARFLRRRGWVVFYLEEQSRVCNGDTCWLKLYQSSLEREGNP